MIEHNVSIIEQAEELLSRHRLCNSCLGRLFGKLGHGFSNEERGKAIRTVVDLHLNRERRTSPEKCSICAGLYGDIEIWAKRCWDEVREVEFESFLVGSSLPPEVKQGQRKIEEEYCCPAEPPGHAFNRSVGKRIKEVGRKEGRSVAVDFERPQIKFLIEVDQGKISYRIQPLYFYGRYRKLVRGIPQTEWNCRSCRGNGCPQCDFSGKMYPESVEELIGSPVIELCKGRGGILHGAGREDVDALMLGCGRPFVLEITDPKVRNISVSDLAQKINIQCEDKVEVRNLTAVNGGLIGDIKGTRLYKIYRLEVRSEQSLAEETFFEALKAIEGPVFQRTPTRVSHRRPDKVRVRRVSYVRGDYLSPTEFRIRLKCEGGLYVKELISSNGGRTIPSLAELTGADMKVTGLDVMEVLGKIDLDKHEQVQFIPVEEWDEKDCPPDA